MFSNWTCHPTREGSISNGSDMFSSPGEGIAVAADAGNAGGVGARSSAPVLPVLSSAGGAVSTTTTFFFTARYTPMHLCLPGILESNAVAAVSGVPVKRA